MKCLRSKQVSGRISVDGNSICYALQVQYMKQVFGYIVRESAQMFLKINSSGGLVRASLRHGGAAGSVATSQLRLLSESGFIRSPGFPQGFSGF